MQVPQASTMNISLGHKEYNSLALCVAVPQITIATFVTRLTTGDGQIGTRGGRLNSLREHLSWLTAPRSVHKWYSATLTVNVSRVTVQH